MSEISITSKTVILFIVCYCFYFYLNDKLNKPNVIEKMEKSIETAFGSNTTHTFIELMSNYTNLFSGAAATATFSIFYNLPVSVYLDCIFFFIH